MATTYHEGIKRGVLLVFLLCKEYSIMVKSTQPICNMIGLRLNYLPAPSHIPNDESTRGTSGCCSLAAVAMFLPHLPQDCKALRKSTHGTEVMAVLSYSLTQGLPRSPLVCVWEQLSRLVIMVLATETVMCKCVSQQVVYTGLIPFLHPICTTERYKLLVMDWWTWIDGNIKHQSNCKWHKSRGQIHGVTFKSVLLLLIIWY